MRARIDALRAALADDALACAVLVTRAEPMVLAESRRYLDDLAALHVRVAAVIVNALPARDAGPSLGDELPRFSIPLAAEPPRALADVVTTLSKTSAMREAAPPRAKCAATRSTPRASSSAEAGAE
jgi:anion-transporting  ArsA/GET3 family ATPase